METTTVEKTVTKNEANGKKKTKVGALWKRTGQSGNIFFTGEVAMASDDPIASRVNVVAFVRKAADKKDRDGNPKNYPDIEIFLSDRPERPRTEAPKAVQTAASVVAPDDESEDDAKF